MATTRRLDRITGGVRRWRARRAEQVDVTPNLSHQDIETVAAAIEDSISARGGEVAARRRTRALADAYRHLDDQGRLRFFELLVDRYGYDDAAIAQRLGTLNSLIANEPTTHADAYRSLAAVLQPRYRPLLQRLGGMGGGFALTIKMREDLMDVRRRSKELGLLDTELRELLGTWFDVSLLQLERLTWDSPASTLELLIKYEAVHAIGSWADLRQRLGPGRRCYAFMHPAMAGDPLIFVEVALTVGMADSVVPFIQHGGPVPNGADISSAAADGSGSIESTADANEERGADTAIFYSISNCHRGLAGVSLGDFLIKSVVQSIRAELPTIERFATLSPMPGLRKWLIERLDQDASDVAAADLLRPDEEATIANAVGVDAVEALTAFGELVKGPCPAPDDALLNAARPALLRLAARYIVLERRTDSTFALDPVANFHLSNGARAERLNWQANPSTAGWERGLGMMINYRYRIQSIERNHDLYVNAGEVVASPALIATLDDRPLSRR